MEGFVYLVGAVYVADTLARLTFWVVDMVEQKKKKIFREAYKMFENLKKAVISNGWKFPEGEIKRWYAGSSNGSGSVLSGIVQTRHYGKIYFSIISPWAFCPEGEVIIERA